MIVSRQNIPATRPGASPSRAEIREHDSSFLQAAARRDDQPSSASDLTSSELSVPFSSRPNPVPGSASTSLPLTRQNMVRGLSSPPRPPAPRQPVPLGVTLEDNGDTIDALDWNPLVYLPEIPDHRSRVTMGGVVFAHFAVGGTGNSRRPRIQRRSRPSASSSGVSTIDAATAIGVPYFPF